MRTSQETALRLWSISFLPDQAPALQGPSWFPLEQTWASSPLPSPYCRKKCPRPSCGGHRRHCDQGSGRGGTGGCPGMFPDPRQDWKLLQLFPSLPPTSQSDPRPGGRRPHPVFRARLSEPSPRDLSLIPQLLPHQLLTLGCFLNSFLLCEFSQVKVSPLGVVLVPSHSKACLEEGSGGGGAQYPVPLAVH